MIPRPVQFAIGLFIAALVTVGPFLYQSYHNRMFRNVRVVEDGVLYRSAQLPIGGLQRLINDYRIKTVVCLRHGDKVNDQAEEAYCQENGIRFVRIPPRSWSREDGTAPAEEGLAKFREVMKDQTNFPVLLHCFAGTHRTGAYVAVYRMDFQGWSNEKALNELRGLGYVTLEEDKNVFEFLSSYQRVPSRVSTAVAVHQVQALWENRVITTQNVVKTQDVINQGSPLVSLAGRVYFFGEEVGYPLLAKGTLTVDAHEMLPDGTSRIMERWEFDPATLQKIARQDVIGWGYTVFLPWSTYRADIRRVQLQVKFVPERGMPLFSPPNTLSLSEVAGQKRR